MRERQKEVLAAASMKLRHRLASSESTTVISTTLEDHLACGSIVPPFNRRRGSC